MMQFNPEKSEVLNVTSKLDSIVSHYIGSPLQPQNLQRNLALTYPTIYLGIIISLRNLTTSWLFYTVASASVPRRPAYQVKVLHDVRSIIENACVISHPFTHKNIRDGSDKSSTCCCVGLSNHQQCHKNNELVVASAGGEKKKDQNNPFLPNFT